MAAQGERRFELSVLLDALAVCRLAAEADVPAWAQRGSFSSITRTTSELSIVCEAASVPNDVAAERDWRCLRVAGPLAFSEVGVLSALSSTLASAGVSIFPVSTYETDYLLVRSGDLASATLALEGAGHGVIQ